MRLFVLSDAHIDGPADPLYGTLIDLLKTRMQPGDTLVLAGDIFELFIGEKEFFTQRYSAFMDALTDASKKGCFVHYIEGNHDFLLRSTYSHLPGVKVHAREVQLELGGKKFFIAHGDLVNEKDYSYRLLRAFFRSHVMRAFVRLAPGPVLKKIGDRSSRYSRGEKHFSADNLDLTAREHQRKLFRSFGAMKIAQGFDCVVLGHSHDLDEMTFTVGDRCGQYINMGYPQVHKSFLVWSPGDPLITREPFEPQA